MALWDKLNPFGKKDAAEGAKAAPATTAAPAAPEAEAGLFKRFRGMMPQMKQFLKNPEFLAKLKVLQAMMEKEGIDYKDQKAVEAWMKANQERLARELGAGAGPKVETVVREEPKIGRNDPCHCGSGKKFKKCHG